MSRAAAAATIVELLEESGLPPVCVAVASPDRRAAAPGAGPGRGSAGVVAPCSTHLLQLSLTAARAKMLVTLLLLKETSLCLCLAVLEGSAPEMLILRIYNHILCQATLQ